MTLQIPSPGDSSYAISIRNLAKYVAATDGKNEFMSKGVQNHFNDVSFLVGAKKCVLMVSSAAIGVGIDEP